MKNLFAYLCLISASAIAQTNDTCIYTPQPLKKGVYLNFNEYQANDPSITSEFEVVEEPFSRTGRIKIKYTDSTGKVVSTNRQWGFSNGKNVYLTYTSKHLLGVRGPVSFLIVEPGTTGGDRPYGMYGMDGMYAMSSLHPELRAGEYIIDEKGELFRLTKRNLEKAISKDTELVAMFREYKGPDKLYRFIRLYNCRHPRPL